MAWFHKGKVCLRQMFAMEDTSRSLVLGKQEKSVEEVGILNYNEKVLLNGQQS